MEIKHLIQSLGKIREQSSKRKFKQTIDFIATFKDIDLKKADQQVDFYATLHYSKGKPVKVAALVGPELLANAKENCETAINVDDFDQYVKDKKLTKKLATDHDFFIAQATIMPKVATSFGKVLGPKGKMPNPKAGCVVPPNANLKPLVEKLTKTVKVIAKTMPMVQVAVGTEEMKDEEIADNIKTVYDQLVHNLPNEKHNVNHIILKLTMGKPFRIDEKGNIVEIEQKEEPKEEGKAKKKEDAKPSSEKKKKSKAEEKPKKEKKKAPKKDKKKDQPKESAKKEEKKVAEEKSES
ncbi:MAG: hypothetical protein QF632_05365 [Candidatus Woesearchaeota archaeon]|jgi:large subunit ribosomal protein L1|nr:hypothetical protein [Candidatus Woesearchaeota archaeon]MDP7324159.1 hypothetical protein [Candidatus Woesearchaeota archaeon]